MTLDDRPKYKGLPIPFVQAFKADGTTPDFTAIDPIKAMECARHRLCGLCGEKMGWWVAFVGGPQSAKLGTYGDPAMHPECAEQALELCPHIANQRTSRATKVAPNVVEQAGYVAAKPEQWCVYITRNFELKGFGNNWFIKAAAAKRIDIYEYNNKGKLVKT